MTTAQLKDLLLAQLGSGGVVVELDDNFVEFAIKRALLFLSVYAPRKGSVFVITEPHRKVYELDGLPQGAQVVEVRSSANTSIPFNLWTVGLVDVMTSNLSIADFVYLLNWAGTVKKVLGGEFTCEFKDRVLYISPEPKSQQVLEVLYVMPYERVEDVDYKYLDVLFLFALGSAKEMLGRIRGKYRGVPAPEGQVELDAEQLLEEARQHFEEAQDKIRRLQPAPAFVVG